MNKIEFINKWKNNESNVAKWIGPVIVIIMSGEPNFHVVSLMMESAVVGLSCYMPEEKAEEILLEVTDVIEDYLDNHDFDTEIRPRDKFVGACDEVMEQAKARGLFNQ